MTEESEAPNNSLPIPAWAEKQLEEAIGLIMWLVFWTFLVVIFSAVYLVLWCPPERLAIIFEFGGQVMVFAGSFIAGAVSPSVVGGVRSLVLKRHELIELETKAP